MVDITKEQPPLLPGGGSGSDEFDAMFALVLKSGLRDNPSELDPVSISIPGYDRTPPGELWFRYDVRRTCADGCIKQYLDSRGKALRGYLQSLYNGEPIGHHSPSTIAMLRLTDFRDTLLRDLFFMTCHLKALRTAHDPGRQTKTISWIILCLGVLLSSRHNTATTLISAIGAGIGLYVFGYRYLRARTLAACEAQVDELILSFWGAQVDGIHRDFLNQGCFRTLEWFRIRWVRSSHVAQW